MLHCYHRIDEIPAAHWNTLASATAHDPFLSRSWFELFETELCPADYSCRYYLFSDDTDRPRALLPCLARLASGRVTELSALSNYYTGTYRPLIAPDSAPSDCLRRLLAAIAAREPDCWRLDLRPLHRHRPEWPALLAALQQTGWETEPFFCHGNWLLECAGLDFDDYWRQRPPALQHTCARKARKLERELGLRFECHTEPGDALDKALAHFRRIYALSWKQAESHPDFIDAWCRRLAKAGALRLGLLYGGDRVIAAQIWLVNGHQGYIFKLAHDPDFARFSPGSLLTRELMRQLLDGDKVTSVDFLTGDDPYKRDWMSQRHEVWGVRAYRRGHPKGLAAALISRARSALRAGLGRYRRR